jgi:hypothetical protein
MARESISYLDILAPTDLSLEVMKARLESKARSQKSCVPNPKFRLGEGLLTKATRCMKKMAI